MNYRDTAFSADHTHHTSFPWNPRDAPTTDELLQAAGAESFDQFEKQVQNFDKGLRNLSNKIGQLGSSVGVLSSAYSVRERLMKMLALFRENAAELFPRRVSRKSKDPLANPNLMERRKKRDTQRPSEGKPEERPGPEKLPGLFDHLAVDVASLLRCMNDFSEFIDEDVSNSLHKFEGDLKYWSSCLQEYSSQFRTPAVRRYIHDLSPEIGSHLDHINVTISVFIEIGVPMVEFAQHHSTANLTNLSTAATFFSAVTAMTLQYSYSHTGKALDDIVNAFWFSSLVFSIAAAVNGLLGLTWKQAMYRSPGHRVPWWVLIWIERVPLAFLIFSVACFTSGLLLFAYSSHQNRITSLITTGFIAMTSSGLIAVSAWFASERWMYMRHGGDVWLQDVIAEETERLFRLSGVAKAREAFQRGYDQVSAAGNTFRHMPLFTQEFSFFGNGSDPGSNGGDRTPVQTPFGSARPSMSRQYSSFTITTERHMSSDETGEGKDDPPFNARERFIDAIRKVIDVYVHPPSDRIPQIRVTSSATPVPCGPHSGPVSPTSAPATPRNARSLKQRLKTVEVSYEISVHQALVRHSQFSPDGKYLATSSWDKKAVIYRVEDFSSHRILLHTSGLIGQVAWSPEGHNLMTKLKRSIKIWSLDGVCSKTINRPRTVQSITWLPRGDAIISAEVNEVVMIDGRGRVNTRAEGSVVVKLDPRGSVLETYQFGRINFNSVAVTPDSRRLIGAGPLLCSPTGTHPVKSQAEKQLQVYNMETKRCEHRSPLFNEVRDITISRRGNVALLSYGPKLPPQLWKLEEVRDRENKNLTIIRPSLQFTYMPIKELCDFVGPSYFGGHDDQLVVSAGKVGDIHIWERDTASLLHHIEPKGSVGNLTCIAWNTAIDTVMFAAGSHDGSVRIWTSNDDEIEADNATFTPGTPVSRRRSHSPLASPTSPRERRTHFETLLP